jgi:hypothetical protein
VDPSPVEVEAERFGSAVPEGEGSGGLGRVGEPAQLGEPDRAVTRFHLSERFWRVPGRVRPRVMHPG